MLLKTQEKIKIGELAFLAGSFAVGLGIHFTSIQDFNDLLTGGVVEANLCGAIGCSPYIIDLLTTFRREVNTSDLQEIKKLYNQFITNVSDFSKKLNFNDPVSLFTMYQFMYRNGYVSKDNKSKYDIDMKDFSSLNGVDVIRGTGVCRSYASFLTDLFNERGMYSSNLLVNTTKDVLLNGDHLGNYPTREHSEQTKKMVDIVMKYTNMTGISNHVVTLVADEDNSFVFDPTNDLFLVKGENNRLLLANDQDYFMRISPTMYRFHYLLKSMNHLDKYSSVEEKLELPTVPYRVYRRMYLDALQKCKRNIEGFKDFYLTNQSLIEDITNLSNEQDGLIKRICPIIKK